MLLGSHHSAFYHCAQSLCTKSSSSTSMLSVAGLTPFCTQPLYSATQHSVILHPIRILSLGSQHSALNHCTQPLRTQSSYPPICILSSFLTTQHSIIVFSHSALSHPTQPICICHFVLSHSALTITHHHTALSICARSLYSAIQK